MKKVIRCFVAAVDAEAASAIKALLPPKSVDYRHWKRQDGREVHDVTITCDESAFWANRDAILRCSKSPTPTTREELVFTKSEIADAELCVSASKYATSVPIVPEHGYNYRAPVRPAVPTPWCWYQGRLLSNRSGFPDQRRCLLWPYNYETVVSDFFLDQAAGCDLSAVTPEPIFDRRTSERIGWSLLRGTRLASLDLAACEGIELDGHILHDPPIPVFHSGSSADGSVWLAERFAVHRASVLSSDGAVPDAIFTRELGPELRRPNLNTPPLPPSSRLLLGPRVREILQRHMKSKIRLEPVTLV
jgi:hypothetical protein